jgi:hypothetical protein
MPRFIPNVKPDDIEHDSERLVVEALADLPDGYVVLHSLPWLRPNRHYANEPLQEGEADFVILHPDRGMLVLEVKGGVPELRNRLWFRNGREIRDPFEQARKSRYNLLDSIEARTGRRLHRQMFTHGDMVVFPHCTYDGPLPLNTDPRIIADATGLYDLASRVEEAFQAWERTPTALNSQQFDDLQAALMPKLRLMRCVGTEIDAERARILQVTENQRVTYRGLLASDRVLVEGTAGSGKTLLALEFAVSLAAAGESVLFLCYNRHLMVWLREQAAAEPRLQGKDGKLEIYTFHSYAFSLAKKAGVEFTPPTLGDQQFWDEEAPMILEQALEILRDGPEPPQFDAVVIDEAQDFSQDWWVTIEGLSRGGSSGRLYAFLDLHQSLRGEAMLPPVSLPARFPLTANCRNTRAIARSAAVLIGTDGTLLPFSPEGEAPAVRGAHSHSSDTGVALNELRRLLKAGVKSSQIVVIQPTALDNSPFARFQDVEGVSLVSDAAKWRRGEGILVTTARAFKGLEADVVIVCGLSAFSTTFTKADLYVAWTRARHRLVVVCHGPEAKSLVEGTLAEAERGSSRVLSTL